MQQPPFLLHAGVTMAGVRIEVPCMPYREFEVLAETLEAAGFEPSMAAAGPSVTKVGGAPLEYVLRVWDSVDEEVASAAVMITVEFVRRMIKALREKLKRNDVNQRLTVKLLYGPTGEVVKQVEVVDEPG